MSDDEVKPPPRFDLVDPRLIRSIGNSLLGIKGALDRIEQALREGNVATTAHLSTLMTELKLLDRGISETRRDIDAAADRIRDDITPVHGTPLPARDEMVEVGPTGVKASAAALARVGGGLPWLVLGILLGGAALVVALWASGVRLLVRDQDIGATRATAPAMTPPQTAPAIPVPPLRPPPATVPGVVSSPPPGK